MKTRVIFGYVIMATATLGGCGTASTDGSSSESPTAVGVSRQALTSDTAIDPGGGPAAPGGGDSLPAPDGDETGLGSDAATHEANDALDGYSGPGTLMSADPTMISNCSGGIGGSCCAARRLYGGSYYAWKCCCPITWPPQGIGSCYCRGWNP